MGAPKKPLVFLTTPAGCFVPTSHALNSDGYFRFRLTGRGLVMFHRLILEARGVYIPDGFEVDHLYNNRTCANPAHLRVIDGTAHAVHTKRSRYAERKETASRAWGAHSLSGTELAAQHEVSVSAACRWIREWSDAD